MNNRRLDTNMSQIDNEKIEKMIKENEKLIYFVYNKLSENAYIKRNEDELCGAGLVGLWKGCKTYDESKKVKLSTYLCRCIKNEMLQVIRSQNLDRCKINNKAISFETPITQSESDTITLEDTLYYNQDYFGLDIEEYVDMYFKNKKRKKDIVQKVRTILQMLADDIGPREIARKLSMGYTSVYRYINNIKKAILLDREKGE